MVGADLQAGVEVEAVGVGAVGADAGVEVKLIASESASLVGEPVEQAASVPAAPGLRKGREVVDVEEASPGGAVGDAEAGHRDGVGQGVLERPDEPVALGALNPIDAMDKLRPVNQLSPKGLHRRKRETRVWRNDLPDHRLIFQSRSD